VGANQNYSVAEHAAKNLKAVQRAHKLKRVLMEFMDAKPNSRKKRIIKFGNVTVVADPLSKSEIKRNVKAGQRALARALKAIITPGVDVKLPSGVPLYRADSEKRGHIIRELDGKSESGVIENGKFKPIK
jgi:hypothetical protein